MTDSLFATCPLPGCDHDVATQGHPCDTCIAAFGDLLHHTPGGTPPTAADRAARDTATLAAYRGHAAIADRAGQDDDEEGETRSNQLCWMCDTRRRCTRVEGRWECRDCMTIA